MFNINITDYSIVIGALMMLVGAITLFITELNGRTPVLPIYLLFVGAAISLAASLLVKSATQPENPTGIKWTKELVTFTDGSTAEAWAKTEDCSRPDFSIETFEISDSTPEFLDVDTNTVESIEIDCYLIPQGVKFSERKWHCIWTMKRMFDHASK